MPPSPPPSPFRSWPLRSPRASGAGFGSKVAAVFLREARTEARNRFSVNAVAMFALSTLLLVGLSTDAATPHKAKSGLLWLVLLFSAMTGLSRAFVREVEGRTQDSLRLTCDPGALLVGKTLFNAALLGATQALITPLFVLMTDLPIRSASLFLTMLLLGNLGLTVVSTLLAALVAKAGGRGALFPVLALPLLIPLFLALVGGTYAALVPDMKVVAGAGYVATPEATRSAWEAGASYARLAAAYAGVLGPAALLLFEFIWEED